MKHVEDTIFTEGELKLTVGSHCDAAADVSITRIDPAYPYGVSEQWFVLGYQEVVAMQTLLQKVEIELLRRRHNV